MNGNQDNLRSELGRALHQQADGIGGTPISFEQVKGTAGRIRRRRAIAASAAVAAAVAIVVPTVMMSTNLGPDAGKDDTLPPATQSPTALPTRLDVRDLPQGDAPDIPWVQDGVLLAGGAEVRLPAGTEQVASLGDVYVVARATDVVVLDSLGDVLATHPAAEHSGLAINAAGTAAAWMTAENAPMVWQEGHGEALRYAGQQGGGNPQPVGLTGEDCTADAEQVEGAGCSVFFTLEDTEGGRQTYVSSTHGNVDLASRTLKAITAVSRDGRFAGITEFRDDGTCSAVTGPHSDGATWTTCAHRLHAFSPDGTLLLGPQAYGSGIGDGEVAILDAASGDVLVSLDNRESQAFVGGTAWEDDEHVLAEVFQAGEWALVRIGLDGAMEYAVGPVPGNDLENPFRLSTQP